MNIRQAKQEVVDTVRAYLLKDEYGEYEIPTVRQRPVLILEAETGSDPWGSGNRKNTDYGAGSPRMWGGSGILYNNTPHQAERHRSSFYFKKRIRGQIIFCHRIYHE